MMKRFLNDVVKYYNYMVRAAKSELKTEVANSYLNWIWWILDPLFSMLTYYLIFGVVFNDFTETKNDLISLMDFSTRLIFVVSLRSFSIWMSSFSVHAGINTTISNMLRKNILLLRIKFSLFLIIDVKSSLDNRMMQVISWELLSNMINMLLS